MAIRILSSETINGDVTISKTSAVNLRVTDGTQNVYVGSSGSTRFGLSSGASIIQSTGADFGIGTQDGNNFVLGANNTAVLTLDTSANATFAGDVNVQNASTRFISLNYEDSVNSIISHSGTNFGLESLNVRGDNIYFYTDYDSGTPKGNLTLTLDTNHNATFTGNVTALSYTATDFINLQVDDAEAYWTNTANTDYWRWKRDANNNFKLDHYNGSATNNALTFDNTQNATFEGNVTVNGTFTFDNVINAVRASFVSTLAGATVVSTEGAYASSGSVKLYEAKRSGGAVAGDWSYDDATTDMSLGTNTNHNFSIKTNNSRVLNVTNTGRVGIGVSPSYKLQVLETGGASTNIGIYTNVQGTGANNYAFYADATQGTSNNFAFYAASGESAFLGATGVGTNNPEKKLHVKGTTTDDTPQVLIQNSSSGDASLTFNVSGQSYVMGIDQDDSSKFKIAASGNLGTNDRVTILSDGKVGIGTITPSTPLMVNRASNSNEPGIFYDVTGGGSGCVGIGSTAAVGPFIVGNTLPNGNVREAYAASRMLFNGGGFSFQTSDETSGARTWDDKMKIEIGGNVGIGLTNPSGKLEVFRPAGQSSYPQLILSTGESGSSDYSLSTDVTAPGDFCIVKGNSNVAGNVKMKIDSSGNVGIGINDPTTTLSVQGTTNNGINVIGVGTTATRVFAGLNSSNHGYLFVTGSSGQSPSVINSAGGDSYISGGDLGIGTTTPQTKLDVRGNIVAGDSTTDNTIRRKYQNFSTTKPGPSSGGNIDMMFADHTHALDITVLAYINTSTVAVGRGYSVTAYGSNSTGFTQTQFSPNGTISAMSLSYVNSGGSESYILRVNVTYTGSTAPVITMTANGTSTGTLRAAT